MTSTFNVPNMRVCAIDVGTNSTRYMIADLDSQRRSITVLFQGTQMTRLGANIGSGKIRAENAAKTLGAIQRFYEHALSLAVSDFKIFGTAALREAKNGKEFCQRVREATGFTLEIIAGAREARLMELAIADSLGLNNKGFLGFDIGGGSTQLLLHQPQEASRHCSLPLGAVGLTEGCLLADPPTAPQIQSVRRRIQETLQKSSAAFPLKKAETLVGAGGTVTTLAAMVQGLKTYDHGKIHGSVLRRTDWEQFLNRLAAMPAASRALLPGLPMGRQDIIVAGLIVLQEIARCLDAEKITVSDRGVLYGALVEYLEEMH